MTHYDTLGVAQGASEEEIRQAYKKLAKKFHPDRNPNNPQAEAKFKEIAAAYGELSDPTKRAQYDQALKYGSARSRSGPGWTTVNFDPFNPFGGGFFHGSGLDSVFRKKANNNHITTSVRIGFLDAKAKHVRNIKYKRKISCKKCNGSGAKAYHAKPCASCGGAGVVTQKLMGVLHSQQRCSPCKGIGKLVKTACGACNSGFITENAEVSVNIPAGILDGKTLRVPGEGNHTNSGKGDLLISVNISPPAPDGPNWTRNGSNVILKMGVPYPTLVLGGEIEVPTIWGLEKVKIPPRTKVGETIMLPGKGFPRLGNMMSEERGVQHILVDLLVPDIHTSKHTQLLKELDQMYNDKVV